MLDLLECRANHRERRWSRILRVRQLLSARCILPTFGPARRPNGLSGRPFGYHQTFVPEWSTTRNSSSRCNSACAISKAALTHQRQVTATAEARYRVLEATRAICSCVHQGRPVAEPTPAAPTDPVGAAGERRVTTCRPCGARISSGFACARSYTFVNCLHEPIERIGLWKRARRVDWIRAGHSSR